MGKIRCVVAYLRSMMADDILPGNYHKRSFELTAAFIAMNIVWYATLKIKPTLVDRMIRTHLSKCFPILGERGFPISLQVAAPQQQLGLVCQKPFAPISHFDERPPHHFTANWFSKFDGHLAHTDSNVQCCSSSFDQPGQIPACVPLDPRGSSQLHQEIAFEFTLAKSNRWAGKHAVN